MRRRIQGHTYKHTSGIEFHAMVASKSTSSKSLKSKEVKFSDLRTQLEQLKLDSTDLARITHRLQSATTETQKLYRSDLDPFEGFRESDVKWDIPFPPPRVSKFTFIDLFAGIGGMRAAFQSLGGRCVFSSEWDQSAKKTYFENFGEVPFGDITKIGTSEVPKHEILVAGFPCQAFSIAGARGGFEDTRGTLFFDVARIIADKKPQAFLLENVKGLANHDRGRTLETILNTLRNDLGYNVPDPQILNAKFYGVPQNRERIFIVGFKSKSAFEKFVYPKSDATSCTISDVLEEREVSVKYYLSTQYLKTLQEHRRRHEEKGNGFGYEIIPNDGISNAIVVGGMGRERNLVIDGRLSTFKPITNIKGSVNRKGIRKMTPREWARLQGFPDRFVIPVSDAQAYKQFGNSVAVPVIAAVGKQIMKALGI
jgi:DNA (cytosine-5)-methyltransferase 1